MLAARAAATSMSTKVLQGAEVKLAEALIWRTVGGEAAALEPAAEMPQTEGGAARAEPAEPPHPPPPPAAPPAQAEPAGPSWDEYRTLEAERRKLEASIPEIEKRARAEGRKEGEAAGQAAWKAAIDNAARSVSQMTALRGRLRKEAERDVVQLSLAIARRVLRRELSVDPEALQGLVRTAFERVEMREVHRVRVRPADAAAITEYLARAGGTQKVETAPDPGLEAGAIIVESARGNLDASLDTQLSEIERGFTDLLTRRGRTDES